MKGENSCKTDAQAVLDKLTRTLLYEGYSLFPYHRSAIKNQKPIPFGVIYPKIYHLDNPHALTEMQSQCIVVGEPSTSVSVTIRFLHLIGSDPVGDESEEKGWQTIEREIIAPNMRMDDLIKADKETNFLFDKKADDHDNPGPARGNAILPLSGKARIKAEAIEDIENAFRISVNITNTSLMDSCATLSRDEALKQSFLSTHIIFSATQGEFISSQFPPESFIRAMSDCQNAGTWTILVEEDNQTMLSSPIIIADYPKIHSKSKGDLFDSTEIEEALMLHFTVMSDEEKKAIGERDGKLQAMLKRVKEITPEELIGLHGGMNENK
jgi:hypothetical protein